MNLDNLDLDEFDDGPEDKQPWIPWFGRDYRSDSALQGCSLAARGVAANFFAYCGCESPRRGLFLTATGEVPEWPQAAAILMCTVDEAKTYLAELLKAKAIRMSKSSILFSARQLRMAKRSRVNSENAKLGKVKQRGVKTKNQPLDAFRSANRSANRSAKDSAICSALSGSGYGSGLEIDLSFEDQARANAASVPHPIAESEAKDAHAPPSTPRDTEVGPTGHEASKAAQSKRGANGVARVDTPATADAVARSPLDEVVEHYRVDHPKSRPGEKERGLIRARLGEGYSAADLCRAIDGCHASPHHSGKNETGTKYQSLELIMRNSSKVAGFIELAEQQGRGELHAPTGGPMTAREASLERVYQAALFDSTDRELAASEQRMLERGGDES